MSLNQSRFGKNESQFRKPGQQRPFFRGRGRGGVGPPTTATKPYVSFNPSYKKVVNPQSWQPRRNVEPVNTSNFNSQSSSMSSDSAMPSTPSKGDGANSFPLQFGSISPVFMNRMQVPARTSSASPNLDEQKREQGPFQVTHRAKNKYKILKIYVEEVKQKKLKGILDRLTSRNFEKLFNQVKEVNIDNVVTLNGVVTQIFEKALMEPTFCEMYANFCQHLAAELPELIVDNEKINFRRLLLNKCQEEFEREEREEQEVNKADNEGEDETKQYEELREEMRLNARRRMLGNIRLIGELYKKKMLIERIMHECIKKLLGDYQNPNEKNIEALCVLMSTIGEMIDHYNAKECMDAYFDIMGQLSNNMKLSSGLRFMLKEAIDLRKNNWQQIRFDVEEEAKQRKLKGILDMLTPQNFEKLYKQVKEVNIDNVVTLNGVMSQIFDKALLEPTFCEVYANLCQRLAFWLPELSVDNKKITFRRLLLNKCQEEFEREEREEQEANKVDNEGEDETNQSEELKEEMRLKARRRMLGSIRLIGELYKKKMLTERIMHECIKKLLGTFQNPNEKNIEALCVLMSTIGEMIDHPKAKKHMDAYFDIMGQLSNNMKLSSRLRFMLKDLIDIKKNKWQQRRFDADRWHSFESF